MTDSLERTDLFWVFLCLSQQEDYLLLSAGSVMGSSLHGACDMPSTSGLRIRRILLKTSQMPSRPFYSTQTSSDWSGSSWTVTLSYQNLSARSVTPSSTSATASWSGFCRESTSRRLGKRTPKASECRMPGEVLSFFK